MLNHYELGAAIGRIEVRLDTIEAKLNATPPRPPREKSFNEIYQFYAVCALIAVTAYGKIPLEAWAVLGKLLR